jgi:hypothetical protein
MWISGEVLVLSGSGTGTEIDQIDLGGRHGKSHAVALG